MPDSKKTTLKITKAGDLTKDKIAQVNKILSDIHSNANKPHPQIFSLHIRI